MTAYHDLDALIRDRLSADAPREAPAGLIHAVMARVDATPQARARAGFLSSTGGKLLAAAAVLLIAVVAGTQLASLIGGPPVAGDSPSPSASETPAPSPSPTLMPSASPTPGTGELPTGPGDAVMSFSFSCDLVGPVTVPATTVLEDGRVVWRPEEGPILVRQLAPDSLKDFRARVRETGLFGESASFDIERRPDAPEPPGRGVCVWTFRWTDGDAPEVEVASVEWLGDEHEETYNVPSPERETLDGLARELMDPTTWYGDDGWLQPEAVPYEPIQYLVKAQVTDPQASTLGAPDVDDVPWPFEEPPDAFGEEAGSGPNQRCGFADAADVEALAAELAAAGLEQFATMPASGVGAALPWAARDAAVDISIWIVLPDGRPTCDEVN